ncbi:MAG TPA: ATP-dependent DNA helicase RecG [Fimbriimonadales bacterium]|nr:ATP-dependent DNA helicase RecG [Fimbriimonadales bacterium]
MAEIGTYRPRTEVQYLKGVGPKVAQLLAKVGIKTLEDLLYYVPRRYEDRTKFASIREVKPGDWVTLKGKIISLETISPRMGTFRIVKASLSDTTGTIGLTWFNQPWIRQKLQRQEGELIVYGQVKVGKWGYEINNPEWEFVQPHKNDDFAKITPIYPLTEGLNEKLLRKVIRQGLNYVNVFPDMIPKTLRERWDLKPLHWSLKQIHFPDSEETQRAARRRLVFEEFFYLQVALALRHQEVGIEAGISFETSPQIVSDLEKATGFQLTNAQKRVIEEIFADMRRPHPMNRLLQGDVGSGKTLVAAAAMLAAVRSSYQAAIMAPTEILAEQHYMNFKRLLAPLNVEIVLFLGKQKPREREEALQKARDGKGQIIVGTHALISEGVEFQKLGFVVIDEQHRFGVMQRAALRRKGLGNPDVLVMTATPIPRSLTLTIYGDLDLSVIDEMPPGRQPVRTHWKRPDEREKVYEGVRKLLNTGLQAYIVCPLISESEKMQAQAAEELYQKMKNEIFPEFRVGLLHGQLKSSEKDEVMEEFRAGKIQVLVSTTVIEVGVDVPNAGVMVIEDANRFGLAQLHQLRGRVGRGGKQSYCVLIGSDNTPEAEARLKIMEETTDGFRIAEEDLKIRGPGELYGTKQAGAFELRVADLLREGKLLEEARQAAFSLLKEDPGLTNPEYREIRKAAEKYKSKIVKTDVS